MVDGAEDRGTSESMMTLRQASRRTGLSATTLRRYIKSSRLRARLVPGRYGPEYVVSDDDLRSAGVSLRETTAAGPQPSPSAGPSSALPAQQAPPPPWPGHTVANDAVPALLYRELLMKHEQLLVQYGMLRVGGLRIYETRNEAERTLESSRTRVAELEAEQARLELENEDLRVEVRRLELAVAAREDELREEQRTVRRLEIELRNAERARDIDGDYRAVADEFDFRGEAPPASPAQDH